MVSSPLGLESSWQGRCVIQPRHKPSINGSPQKQVDLRSWIHDNIQAASCYACPKVTTLSGNCGNAGLGTSSCACPKLGLMSWPHLGLIRLHCLELTHLGGLALKQIRCKCHVMTWPFLWTCRVQGWAEGWVVSKPATLSICSAWWP